MSLYNKRIKINEYQVFAFIILSPVIFLSVFSLILAQKLSAIIWAIIFFILSFYLVIRFLWLLGKSENEEIHFKTRAQKNIVDGVCPLCGTNRSIDSFLGIGYRKRLWKISYKIFYIQYSTRVNEITIKIRICSTCKAKYLLISKVKILSIFKLNPSVKVLKRKLGYLRGIKFPYEKWNLTQN